MRDEDVQREALAERELQRGLQDRAQVRPEASLRLARLDRRAADFYRQHPRCVGDLLREVHLEMADDLPARLSPSPDGGVVGIFDEFSTYFEHMVQRLALPAVEHVEVHGLTLPLSSAAPH